jgi:hypothetical protein
MTRNDSNGSITLQVTPYLEGLTELFYDFDPEIKAMSPLWPDELLF